MYFKRQFIAYMTIVSIEWRRMLRIWPQVLLPPIVTSVLYFIIFGHVMGKRIGMMEGYQYITFIAPGLIMMNVITSAYSSTASSIFTSKFNYSIEEVLVAPLLNTTILFSYMSTGILRGCVVGLLILIVSLIFAHLPIYSFLDIVFTTLFASSIFSLLGIINGIYAKSFDNISIIPTFILTPLIYLGGVFYSIQLLPKIGQYFSYINPIAYIIDSFRYGFLGISHSHLWVSYLSMVLFILLLYSLAFMLLKRGVGLRS